ncbi:hypothetical protein Misp01_65320 [Microtetraspora sp. NBRC 13810]|nr:hypothetical protein Misp01_65320 [Microtetraspora sp. NBRC 13810]
MVAQLPARPRRRDRRPLRSVILRVAAFCGQAAFLPASIERRHLIGIAGELDAALAYVTTPYGRGKPQTEINQPHPGLCDRRITVHFRSRVAQPVRRERVSTSPPRTMASSPTTRAT